MHPERAIEKRETSCDEKVSLFARDRSGLVDCGSALGQEKKRSLLVIGQSKGYQHESISTAMVTLYNLGRRSKKWDTVFRTDCTAITKKPLKYGAKNLDAFDAIVVFHRRQSRHGRFAEGRPAVIRRAATARASSAFTARPSRSSPGQITAR